MKKKIEERASVRRLKLRKEILRNLDIGDLAVVGGGLDPQCWATRTGNTTQ